MEEPMTNGDFEQVWVYAGAYDNQDLAMADFEAIKDAKAAGWIGKYQSAVFVKEADGKVKILNTDSTTRTSGAKWGMAVGAVAGLIFPLGLLAGLVWGAGLGALGGNIAKGWSAGDIKALGAALDTGEAGVILIAQATPDVAVGNILKNAAKTEQKTVEGDMEDLEAALDQHADEG
jgi:uncharacterized membrane protein